MGSILVNCVKFPTVQQQIWCHRWERCAG